MSYYKDGGRLAHVTLKCFYKCGDLPEILPMVQPSDKTDRAKPKCVNYYNICKAGFQETKIYCKCQVIGGNLFIFLYSNINL
jgi:hypothetical protein